MKGGRSMMYVGQRCSVCGETFWIWRKRSKLKTRDHLKPLFCTTCGKRTLHEQVDEWEDR